MRLRKADKNVLYVEDLDMIDGTPLLDIKPYVPKFDNRRTRKIGWLEGKTDRLKEAKDDGRFLRKNRKASSLLLGFSLEK